MPLTPEAKRMADLILKGLGDEEAYVIAYRVDRSQRSKESIRNSAHAARRGKRLVEYLQANNPETKERELYTAAFRRDLAVRTLVRECSDMESPSASRIRAAQLIGQMADVRLFSQDHDSGEAQRDRAQVLGELRQRLAGLGGDVLDITAESVEESDT